jgi:hypothetical protein
MPSLLVLAGAVPMEPAGANLQSAPFKPGICNSNQYIWNMIGRNLKLIERNMIKGVDHRSAV